MDVIFIVLKGYTRNIKVYKDIEVILRVYKNVNEIFPKKIGDGKDPPG